MHIGFLGLGNMGRPMVRNLLGLGHTLTIYNRTQGKAEDLIAMGAKEAATVAEAVKDVEVAITMLLDDAAVAAVVYGPAGMLQHLPPKGIHLCMSTIGVETSAKLVAAHASADQGYVAAPVFGRVGDVASRHIWIMAGGPEPQVNRCLPIFIALGRGLTRVGPKAALAHALKQGCNVFTAALLDALPGILASCEKAGVAPLDYLRLLNSAIFKIPLVDASEEVMIRRSPDPADLSLDLAATEMLLALQTPNGLGGTLPAVDPRDSQLQVTRTRGRGKRHPAALSQARPMETGLKETPVPELKAPRPTPLPSTAEAEKGPEPERVEELEAPQPTLLTSTVETPKKAEPEVAIASKTDLPHQEPEPQQTPPLVADKAHALPGPEKVADSDGFSALPQKSYSSTFTAMEDKRPVTLDLNRTSHFEAIEGHVWAWSQGKRYHTSWRSLSEVELAFKHILFLSIQRRILLRPEAVLDLRPTFGGGAKVRVGESVELTVSRAAASRLKELLGM